MTTTDDERVLNRDEYSFRRPNLACGCGGS